MSPLTALWVASVIGAGLFYTSGVLSAEALQRLLGIKAKPLPTGVRSIDPALPAVRQAPRPGPDHRPANENGRAPDDRSHFAAFAANEVAQARSMAKTHRMETEALRQQLEVEITTKAAIDLELVQQRAYAEDTSRRLVETQKSASLVPALKKRLEEIEHLQAARARVAEQTEEKIRGLERDLARAKGENARLETQIAARVDTQTALESERDALRREVERLRRSMGDGLTPPTAPPRAQVDPAGMANVTRSHQSGTTRRVQRSEDTLEAGLKQHLSGLLAREPGIIAVLSDDHGFPVAGVGTDQHQEGVSVLSSLVQQLASRVKEFIDLERVERIELADAAGRALRVRLFDWETQPLALACLGKRSLVANPDEELVVSAFPRLLRTAWSA
jgi:hypothetical protein